MGFEAPRRLVRALGESDDWLGRLPALTDETVAREGLDVERMIAPGGRSSLVVLVRLDDGTPAALKLAPPAAAPALERAALECWDGFGAVRLLAAPGDALLLERLHPEMSLQIAARGEGAAGGIGDGTAAVGRAAGRSRLRDRDPADRPAGGGDAHHGAGRPGAGDGRARGT